MAQKTINVANHVEIYLVNNQYINIKRDMPQKYVKCLKWCKSTVILCVFEVPTTLRSGTHKKNDLLITHIHGPSTVSDHSSSFFPMRNVL